jgi:orotidine-5'-phosphate decarboxylase
MFNNRATWRVEVTFVATPPTRQVERASGVSEVEVDDHTIHCVVSGSFQPFLEALRGREVIGLTSMPAHETTELERRGGH